MWTSQTKKTCSDASHQGCQISFIWPSWNSFLEIKWFCHYWPSFNIEENSNFLGLFWLNFNKTYNILKNSKIYLIYFLLKFSLYLTFITIWKSGLFWNGSWQNLFFLGHGNPASLLYWRSYNFVPFFARTMKPVT